jgi:hypothetical protein
MTQDKKATALASGRQGIVTTYHGPGNVKGSRIKATGPAGSITLNYDSGLNSSTNHERACKALADKYGWGGRWIGGGSPDGHSILWVDAS